MRQHIDGDSVVVGVSIAGRTEMCSTKWCVVMQGVPKQCQDLVTLDNY